MIERRADGKRLGQVGDAEAIEREVERARDREGRGREDHRAMRVDECPPDHSAEMRLRDI